MRFSALFDARCKGMHMRSSAIERETRETRIRVVLELDTPREPEIQTGNRMFDHLLAQWAFHARAGLTVEAASVDGIVHHLVEDVAIVLGRALSGALRERHGIERYASETLPMDDALVRCAIDLGGRSFARIDLGLECESVEDLASELIPHFFTSLASNAFITLHLERLAGNDTHHIAEAAFKAFARSCRAAWATSDTAQIVPSTKGVLV
jgi:imidazoleglycerol phosphate dehydratase HisB